MLTRLGGRTALVVAVLLLFCYGIVGIPHGGLKRSISKRINLGLDLKGGIHLLLKDSWFSKGDVDPSWNRRGDPNGGHGRGFERSDLRENPGRVARRQVCRRGGEGRICACMDDNSGYPCYDCNFVGNPFSIWHRSHTRIRADSNDGFDSESLHRCVRFQIDLRRHSPEERKSGNALDLAGARGAT